MRLVVPLVIVMSGVGAAHATDLAERESLYCTYVELDAAYTAFVAAHPRVGADEKLLSVPFWVLDEEQRLFDAGHALWRTLVEEDHLPFPDPFLGPDCDKNTHE